MVGPISLWRGLVQYTAVDTEWKASSGTIPTDHVDSVASVFNYIKSNFSESYYVGKLLRYIR